MTDFLTKCEGVITKLLFSILVAVVLVGSIAHFSSGWAYYLQIKPYAFMRM